MVKTTRKRRQKGSFYNSENAKKLNRSVSFELRIEMRRQISLVNTVPMPSGYKVVRSWGLQMHGIYCTQPLGRFVPLYFGAINAVHPSHPMI